MSDLVTLSQIVDKLHWRYPRPDSVRWSERGLTAALKAVLRELRNLRNYGDCWTLLSMVHMCAINREDPNWESATLLWSQILNTPAMGWYYENIQPR